MTNLDALKEVYTNMGGTADLSGKTTLVEVLNAIAALGGVTSTATNNADAIEAVATSLENSAEII